jgi:hypothetical protein
MPNFDAITRILSKMIPLRKPSSRAIPVALTGAVLVWTATGNIVIDPQTARQLSERLAHLADLAEKPVKLWR